MFHRNRQKSATLKSIAVFYFERAAIFFFFISK